MVNYRGLDETFAALADPTRRALVDRLARGPASVSELAEPFPTSLVAIWKHVRVLEDAGLVRTHKEGRVRHCRLEPDAMDDAWRWMRERKGTWHRRMDALTRTFEEEER